MMNADWGRSARESLYKNLAGMVYKLAWYDSGVWIVDQHQLVVKMAGVLKDIDPSMNVELFVDSALRRNQYQPESIMVNDENVLLARLQNTREEGICEKCGGDDVECTGDCSFHKCLDCGHTYRRANEEERNE